MKYAKRRIAIDAVKLTASNFDEICNFMGCTPRQHYNPNNGVDENGATNSAYLGIYIDTLEGVMEASLGDMIIKGIRGEFYPCKPDIFNETYESICEFDREETFVERLEREHRQLRDRVEKLDDFIASEKIRTVSAIEVQRLRRQLFAMKEYLAVLEERLEYPKNWPTCAGK